MSKTERSANLFQVAILKRTADAFDEAEKNGTEPMVAPIASVESGTSPIEEEVKVRIQTAVQCESFLFCLNSRLSV